MSSRIPSWMSATTRAELGPACVEGTHVCESLLSERWWPMRAGSRLQHGELRVGEGKGEMAVVRGAL